MTITLLEDKLADLERAGIAARIVSQFREHIETAEAPGLQDISAFRMADTWGMSRAEILEAFLYGTRLGIFDLSWNIRCPSCKGFTEHSAHLNLLPSQSHCEYCNIDIRANFDDEVEVIFRVNDNIRHVETVTWDELAQYWDWLELVTLVPVAQGMSEAVDVTIKSGTYYFPGVILLVDKFAAGATPSAAAQTLALVCDNKICYRADSRRYHPGALRLSITNQATRDVKVPMLRRKQYPWTSAAQIASTQSFRDLFSAELISADETFAIRSLVIVFTDIKGSTALYERLGDSDAYYLVKKHFKILTQVVKKYGGAVVKTIGDAVMATFMVSADAVRALFEMQTAFEIFNAQKNIKDDIIIKVGAHRGACIAVTSNERLDYFGRTVNIAARVQGLSTGADIVLSQFLFAEPEVRAIVDDSAWQQRHFKSALRGIARDYELVHLTLSATGAEG